MKKIYLYLILCLFTAGFISCADNENFSTLHNLTADEIAEMARQDSIEEAAKNRINADLVLRYDAEITTSATLYDGVEVPIDITQIADQFGLSEEDLLAGIDGESGAPDIKGFAMQGATHSDYSGATNTGSTWGHWWGADSKVIDWGESAMVFAEFWSEDGGFYVGQFPGHLEDGQKITIIEALKYNDIRVAVVINVTAKAPGALSADVVSTQNLSIDVFPRLNYDADSIEFDLTQALTDLGVSSMEEVSFVSINEDGSYAQEAAIEGIGFYYDENGNPLLSEDGAKFYTYYGEFSDNEISLGQIPDAIAEGETYTLKYGLLAGNKVVMLQVAVAVVPYDNPETAPAGDPEDLSAELTITKTYSDDYASVNADVAETLRNAFKLTTYEIGRAIMRGELKLYQGEVTEEDPVYTATPHPAYWLTVDGIAGGWGEGLVYSGLGYNETELYIFAGNHPENAVAGNSVTTTYIASLNGASVTFNITYNIE